MGRGDKKSKKGKVAKGSFGVSRNRKSLKSRLKRASSAKAAAKADGDAKPKRARKKSEA